ncbi:tricarballylate dehydrogenase [Novipirellula aureliae]|uniref:Tricarballylate dehydrogenase n=1 Tax=Novipirellula aureliae TaxID=2527966 RepID=A0A5C6E5M5_9BACT|nr:NAD(P)/FAD-dependent oxidoreductase [Novipirellula aureliae]TWU44015.1 tricarballylate dehydrogenase [Novipirellula aureliae]
MTQTRIVIIGAGAAGLIAAAEAAQRAANVVLLEKNTKTGVKILMSGGTRCNMTHDTDAKGILPGYGHASRFLRHSVGAFSPQDVVHMFNRLGVATKVESTGKVFPQSDRAIQVRDALQAQAVEAGVKIQRTQPVIGLSRDDHGWQVKTEHEIFEADRVIVAAGGRSWPGCGTTGDAYRWLETLGHTIVETRPALVPLTGGYGWMNELSGVTLEDCVITATNRTSDGQVTTKHKMIRRSSCLFTHFGFSGPAAMDVSRIVTLDEHRKDLRVTLDLVPDRSAEEIELRLLNTAAKNGRRRVSAVLSDWLPNRLASSIAMEMCNDTTIAELSKSARQKILVGLKSLGLPIHGTRGFNKAEVTAGGVSLDEVDPRTMESRIAQGLFIAGEVLDVDGWIGGYNFQAAFSTGRAAGIAAARAED